MTINKHIQKILVSLVFLIPGTATAQNIKTQKLAWQSGTTINTSTTEQFSLSCQFITRGTGSIDWVQKDGAKVTTYKVTGTSGSWIDISATGEFTYNVTTGSATGNITFRRNAQGIEAEMNITSTGKSTMAYKFIVNSVQLQ